MAVGSGGPAGGAAASGVAVALCAPGLGGSSRMAISPSSLRSGGYGSPAPGDLRPPPGLLRSPPPARGPAGGFARRGWGGPAKMLVDCRFPAHPSRGISPAERNLTMADLIAIGYKDEATAEAAADEARRRAKDLSNDQDAIAVIVRDSEG